MTEEKCPLCPRGILKRRKFDFETQVDNGRGMTKQLRIPEVVADVCASCGEAFFDSSSQQRIVAAQRQALGLLSAAEIRKLRGKRTQSEMSELLGIGQKTYTRWESGSHFQSEAFDRYLRMLEMSPSNFELLKQIAQSKRENFSEPVIPQPK